MVEQHGLFIGVINLKEDLETIKMKISMKRLKFLLIDCLQLHPFMEILEQQLPDEIQKEWEEE